jgi:cell division protein FtsL
MVFTVILIFLGALSGAVASAHMANTRRELVQARQALTAQLEANSMLQSRMPQPYTLAEIERIATERLDMAKPDPAQIIYINVPPISHVVLNPELYIPPKDQSFWEEMRIFVVAILDRVFGG